MLAAVLTRSCQPSAAARPAASSGPRGEPVSSYAGPGRRLLGTSGALGSRAPAAGLRASTSA
eukprot:10114779-Alexandrium_andersonii.AAC.1